MKRSNFLRNAMVIGGGTLIWVPTAGARPVQHHHHHHWILPHCRPWPVPPRPRPLPQPTAHAPVEVRSIDARVQVEDQIARTTLTIAMHNPASRQQEGQVLLPVPNGAALQSFGMEGAAGSFQAKILPKEEARRIYDEIVRRSKDPAILEFAGFGAVKSSVFPVPARGEVRLRLVYEELLPADGDRVDFVLPRSESLAYQVKWSVAVDWSMKGGVATVYSPTHDIVTRGEGKRVHVTLPGRVNPGPFRLSALRRKKKEAVASFLAHPDPSGDGGHFLLLMAPPDEEVGKPGLKREVTLVLDRSGSMAGEKLDQARAAALQVVEGLKDGEYFNLIVYNEAVDYFASAPVVVNRENVLRARSFIQGIRVSGGTNIFGALEKAIQQPPTKGAIPIVLFLTDGLPTIGETSEKRIRERIRQANDRVRRVFTFGVGVDVNTPLLSRLADDSRATATFVLPQEKVEVKVASVFRRLSGPVLGFPTLRIVDEAGREVPGRIEDVIPHDLPDFFANDQITITGRYRGRGPLEFRLSGDGAGRKRSFRFRFKPDKRRHDFVPRLWATRKIAILTEALRDLGADSAMGGLTGVEIDRNDPRVKELVDEIVRLSTEYGILTEYTAFLAREGEVFQSQRSRVSQAAENFDARALKERSGLGSVNQELNLNRSKTAWNLNPTNGFLNSELQEESVRGVQQCADKAFYRRGDAWVDASLALASDPAGAPAAQEIAIESEEFKTLVDRLVANGQQSCLALGRNLDVVVDGRRYRLK